jgi:hypothetical protein
LPFTRDPRFRSPDLFIYFGIIRKQFSGGGGGINALAILELFPSQSNIRGYDIPTPGLANTRVAGIRWNEFSETFVLDLQPGHSFEFEYSMEAAAYTDIPNAQNVLDDNVYGAQAMIGDPFNLSGTAGGSITIAPVPEPRAAALLALGLGGLARLGRRRNSGA